MACVLRILPLALALAVMPGPALAQNIMLAQNKVRTETIQVAPPAAKASPGADAAHAVRPAGDPTSGKDPKSGKDLKSKPAAPVPEAITDLSRLPAPVARARERILEAAKSGSLERLVTVMQANEMMPIFSFGNDIDPLALWQATFPDSKGVELLGVLVNLLEAPFVHVDAGTPQEMFIWPYFARYPIHQLDPEQMVELFRIVTGSDYRDMIEFGAYAFYRVGIGPDGVWHFFVAGD